MEQAGIGGDEVTCLQLDDVTGDEGGGVDHRLLAVADDAGVGRGHILQSIQGLLCLTLLVHAHDGVEDDDEQDERGLKQLAPVLLGDDHHEGYDGGGDEDQDHDVLELVDEALEGGLLLLFSETVLTEFGLQLGDLGRGQTRFGVGVQLGDQLFPILTVCGQRSVPPCCVKRGVRVPLIV